MLAKFLQNQVRAKVTKNKVSKGLKLFQNNLLKPLLWRRMHLKCANFKVSARIKNMIAQGEFS